MNKRILSVLLCVIMISFSCLLLYNKNKSITINVDLNGNTNSVEIKVGETLTYSLLGNEYEFKIIDIKKNEISIEVNQYGLTNTSSLIKEDNKFIIEKGKKLELHTQTTDYQESIIFEY